MAPLADLILATVPTRLPYYLSSYVPGVTPLSTNVTVVTALVSYLAAIFGIQAVMKNQQPLKLQTLFQIHNVILSSGSLLLLVLMLEEIVPIAWKSGFHHALCNENAWTSRMEFYYMCNYFFKYLEFVDTIFLVLKKKPLQFLHVFHHSATALLCYTQLNGKTSISWAVITLNLAVHVVMYYYYYATTTGRRFWWKKYLTTMQITQFIIDIGLVYFGTYEHFASTYRPHWPFIGNCAGSEGAALFGCGLLTSYLALFINFYFKTYKKPVQSKKTGATAANGYTNGHANGHKQD
ncbi:fatty acid elongase [Coprinopsis marcescibilis]|uniref:Elongation of fatty acids protein n=1 Tax=Coprinopsis marcescibilis TaxID=230819 RepID=A0A5C3LBJ8_COPMA|nr:fatty acid elongase [Coprinopsis marcescibilis]